MRALLEGERDRTGIGGGELEIEQGEFASFPWVFLLFLCSFGGACW